LVVQLQKFGGIDCEDSMFAVPVSSRRQKTQHTVASNPEEHSFVQKTIPFSGGHPFQTLAQRAIADRFLVSNDCWTVLFMSNRNRLRPTTAFDVSPLFTIDPVQVQQCGSAQKTVTLDGRPRAEFGHVIQARVVRCKLFKCNSHPVYQDRLSIILLESKRVEINET